MKAVLGTTVILTLYFFHVNTQKRYDLTYEFSNESKVIWPLFQDYLFVLKNVMRIGNKTSPTYVEANVFSSAEHSGTHMDAPLHFAYGKRSVSEVPLDDLIGPAFIVDMSSEAKKNKDLLITSKHLQDAEKKQGTIPDGAILLLFTDWGRKWNSVKDFLGTDTNDTSLLHFPGLDPNAATWLINNRKVKALGIDTASIDYGQSTTFDSHNILFKQNIPVFENVANLDQILEKDVTITALPMLIKDGSGAPLRIIATENSPCNRATIHQFSFLMLMCIVAVQWLL